MGKKHLPVYGDILYEVCSLRVCDDDAFRWDRQCYFTKLLSTGSGLWIWKNENTYKEWNKME